MDSIKLSFIYPKTKDVVWAYFTHDDLLKQWCMPTYGFYLQPGKIFRFENNPSTYWHDTFINTLIDYDVCNSLTFRFECEKRKLDTKVTWLFEETDGKTIVSLEHSGFKFKDFFTRLYIKNGWDEMLGSNLRSKLNSNKS